MPRITFDITNVDDLHNQISTFFKTNKSVDQVGEPETIEVEAPKAKPKKTPKKKIKAKKLPNKEDIQAALQSVTENHSLSDAREVLKVFGCERLSDLAEDQYKDFIKACESIDE